MILHAGEQLLFYLVQNDTLEGLLRSNPENLLSRRPLLFFSSRDVNPDHLTHLLVRGSARPGSTVQLRWEDLSHGDQDFNDVILSLRLTSLGSK